MNVTRIYTLMTGVFFSCLIMPMTGFTHETFDPLHVTPIETVESRLASPAEIHVQVTDKGVEVSGILKRHINKKRKHLRGHVDVELLGAEGQVIETATLPIRSRPGPAKHDHERKFSATLAVPSSSDYTVRVRHNIGTDDH